MGEAESKVADKVLKKSWFKGLKSEFKKIVWPDNASIVRQTIAVSIVSIFLGAIIKVLDMIIQIGLDWIV